MGGWVVVRVVIVLRVRKDCDNAVADLGFLKGYSSKECRHAMRAENFARPRPLPGARILHQRRIVSTDQE